MAVNGIPKTERIWVQRTTGDGSVYYITSKENDRSYYFLHKKVRIKSEKVLTSRIVCAII